MAWVYAVALEDSNVLWSPGSNLSPIVKESPTLPASYWEGLEFRAGMTSAHFLGPTSKDGSISWRLGSRARTSAKLALTQAWQESEAPWSSISSEVARKSTVNLYSWKTSPLLPKKWGGKLPDALPATGMMRDGCVFSSLLNVPSVKAKDGFYWLRPRASQEMKPIRKMTPSEIRRTLGGGGGHGKQIACQVGTRWPHLNGKYLHAGFYETLMGFPEGWTQLEPWVMQWYQSKRGKRSKS